MNKKTKTKTNPADTFYNDHREFQAKYPMVYVECWTPEDFVVDEDGDGSLDVDWNDPVHKQTAINLYSYFDAEYGTNWGRVRDAANQQ